MRRLARLLVILCVVQLPAACDSGAQIVDYNPQRGSTDVPSNTPIQITFDRAVDKATVAQRFHVLPTVAGELTWPHPNQLAFVHQPLKTDTDYTVQLDAGYQDSQGHVYSLRHFWQFHTEGPPDLTASTPSPGDRNVDPAGYLSLSFSRQMDLGTLGTALTITPATQISLRLDPSDPRRVILAPRTLLEAGQPYSVKVARSALDVDGNPIPAPVEMSFQTGPNRPLRHWVGVLTEVYGERTPAGVWIVDENRLPRRVSTVPAEDFSWSPDGRSLLLKLADRRWVTQPVGGRPVDLPFRADWAATLGSGLGYVFLDGGSLNLLDGSGTTSELATGVTDAALDPSGARLAYAVPVRDGTEVMAMEVDLRTRYRLQAETGDVSGLAWSPDGQRLAYLVAASERARTQVRVRGLTGGGGVITVAQADADRPLWLDEAHLVFAARMSTPAGTSSRAYRVSALAAGGALSPAQGLPATGVTGVRDPWPSADGHQVAFLAPEAGAFELWLMNADGTGLVQLTDYDPSAFPYSCLALAWTPS